MTDHPNDPDTGPDDAPWLRRALHDVADAEPVRDARADILDTARGVVVPLRPTERRRASSPRRWLAVAAVAAALAGIGGAVVLAGGDDDDRNIVTNPGEDPTSTTEAPTTTATTPTTVVTAPVVSVTTSVPPTSTTTPPVVGGPTGWYVPRDLPEGWRVTGIAEAGSSVDPGACPCRSAWWVHPNGALVEGTSYALDLPLVDGRPDIDDEQLEPAEVAPGLQGWRAERPSGAGTDVVVSWRAEGRRYVQVRMHGLSAGDRAEVVESWRAASADELPIAPPGFVTVHQAALDAGVIEAPSVQLTLTDGTTEATLGLEVAQGSRVFSLPIFDAELVELPDVEGAGGAIETITDHGRFVGSFPGSTSVGIYSPDPSVDLTALARSLRPATADEWAAFVRSVGGPPELEVPAITDLVARAGA